MKRTMVSLTILLLLAFAASINYKFSHPRPHLVKLEWGAVPNTVVYNVYRSEGAESPKVIATVAGGDLGSSSIKPTYIDRDVHGGHTYFYELRAVDPRGVEGPATRTMAAIPLHLGEKFVATPHKSNIEITIPDPPTNSTDNTEGGGQG
jgi:hypothetical protein